MKKKIMLLSSLFFVAVTGLLAQSSGEMIINAGRATSVTVSEHIDVILLSSTEQSQGLIVNPEAAETLLVTSNGQRVSITPKGYASKTNRQKVFLYVSGLKELKVGPNATVQTAGVLDTEQIDVYVDENTTAHVRAIGRIKAHSLNGVDFSVKDLQQQRSAVKAF